MPSWKPPPKPNLNHVLRLSRPVGWSGMGHPGEGRDAVRVFADTPSRLRKFAFGWRTPSGLPPGRNLPPDSIENVLNRLDDGAVLARLGGEYWATGEMIDNRHEQLAA